MNELWKLWCPAGAGSEVEGFLFSSLISTNHCTLDNGLIEILICLAYFSVGKMFEDNR